MNLRDFLQSQYGIRTDIIEHVVTVGTSPTQVVPNNPNRISYAVSNISGQTAFTSSNPSVSTTSGAYLGVGSIQSYDWRVDADTVGYDTYAISTGGGCTLYVREVVIIPDNQS